MDFIGRLEEDTTIAEEEQIVIYGTGTIGKRAYAILKQKGLADKVSAFCDGNPAVISLTIEGKEIMSLDDAFFKYPKAAYLVASCCVRQMVENLQSQGIKKIHIIRC